MMDCTTAHNEMLVADLEELRGHGDTELAMHVRTCPGCRSQAEGWLRAYGAIASGMAALKPSTPALQVRRRRSFRWAPMPRAAAAALTLLLLWPRGEAQLPNVDALARRMIRETPLIAPPAGKQAMVIEKNNLTIVWLYNGETL